MFEKTKGIVLHQIKYDDKKRIVTIYTEKHGRISVIISNTKKLSINLFQAFNVLELNLVHRTNSNLYRISDATVHLNYKTIPYNIEKSSLSSEQIKKIKNDLTVVPKNNFDNINTNTNYKIYSENDNIITIPRYYGIEKFKNPKKIKFNPEKTKIKFTGDLRDYQLEIIDKCMKNIKKSGGGLLVVPCGMGKCLGKDTRY